MGNSNPLFAKQMAQKTFNGTTVKGCNPTGTTTNSGYPEATFNWKVARQLKRMLEAQGAQVELTRSSNSRQAWGPCVWDRAMQANRIDADTMVNIHADGGPAKGLGFFWLAPGLIKGWTKDVVKPGSPTCTGNDLRYEKVRCTTFELHREPTNDLHKQDRFELQ